MDELLLGVLVQGARTEFAAQSALLVSAEGVGGADHVPVVDPDDAGLELAGNIKRTLGVRAPDTGGKPVLSVIGDPDRLLDGLAADHRKHRAEDFLARDRHAVVDVDEDRRLYPEAALELRSGRHVAAVCQSGALLLAGYDVPQDAVEGLSRNDRSEVGGEIERNPDRDRPGAVNQALDELVVHAAQHDDPGTRLTSLALIHQAAEQSAVHGDIQVCVVEHDAGSLAAKLQGQALHVARGLPHDLSADGRRPGEGDLPDVRMAGAPCSYDW